MSKRRHGLFYVWTKKDTKLGNQESPDHETFFVIIVFVVGLSEVSLCEIILTRSFSPFQTV